MSRALQPAGLFGLPNSGGKGQYNVGPNQTYADIQSAVDTLVADQGPNTFTATQEIVVHQGVYAPFRIEPDALRPTEDFRLNIRAATNTKPVVSGRVDPDKSSVGCLIGNNVPYVSVHGLFFRELIKGITFGVNCHDGWVTRCMFMQCHNVGVWFYQSDECLLDNSVLINCGHGVVFTLAREANILHNTFYNDGRAYLLNEGNRTYCIWVELQEDRGQGIEDYGTATIKNNIIFSATDIGMKLWKRDLKHLDSDYNDWYCPGQQAGGQRTGGLVEIQEPGVASKVVQDLGQIDGIVNNGWRIISSGQDRNSISDDPGFLKPSSDEDSAKIDLDLFQSSPVIGKGTRQYTVPTYLSEATLFNDFNDIPRAREPIAIGAFSKYISTLPGDTIFPNGDNPDGEEDGGTTLFTEGNCEDDVTARDSAAQVYASAIPAWYPEVHRGEFYVRDQGYHLFKNKRGLFLKNTQRTTFSTNYILQPDGLTVEVAGKDVTEQTRWEASGYTFTIWHDGLTDFDEASDVVVQANSRFWNDAIFGFENKAIRHRWKLNEGFHRYVLPTNPDLGSPVVVTDDLLAPGNTVGLVQEFKTEYDNDSEETEIIFGGPNNLWANSDFSYRDDETPVLLLTGLSPFEYDMTGYLPKDHEIEAAGFVGALPRARISAGQEHAPARGFYSMVLGPAGSGYVAQRVKVNPDNPYTFSLYGSLLETGLLTGDLSVSMEFYDQDHQLLKEAGPYTGQLVGGPGTETQWTRLGLSFYPEPDTTINRAPFSDDAQELVTGLDMPAQTRWVVAKIHPSDTYYVGVDAIQVERGYRPGLYTRLPKGSDATIEYEEGDARFYVVDDFTIQPVRNPNARGFLSVVPISAHHWDGNAPDYATTLSDAQWGWGRVNVLPWAKTSGWNKYVRMPFFSTDERVQFAEKVSISPQVAYPLDIIPNPSTVIARQSTAGEDFTIEVLDQLRNPYMFEYGKVSISDPRLLFPGYLAERRWSVWSSLGPQVDIQFNEAGEKTVRFIPPEEEDVEYRGPKPALDLTTGLGITRAGSVDVPYRVYPNNHGNVVIRDENDQKLNLVQTGLSVNIDGTPVEDHTTFSLGHYPEPGSFELFASVTGEDPATMLQESFSTPLRDRHYLVDYERGRVTVKGNWPFGFRADYDRKLAWRTSHYPRRIYIDELALNLTTGQIIVKYDAYLDLQIEALSPTGMPGMPNLKVRIDAVAQHGDRSFPWQ